MKRLKNIVGICDLVQKYVNYLEKEVKSAMECQNSTVPPEFLYNQKNKDEKLPLMSGMNAS